MPQYLPFNETNIKEVFNIHVTGNFDSLATVAKGAAATAADNILSLAMDKASEAYTLNSFVVTITNEFGVVQTPAENLIVLLETATTPTGDNTNWTTIGTATNTAITGFSSTAIALDQYVRLRITSKATIQPSFHVEVNGTRF